MTTESNSPRIEAGASQAIATAAAQADGTFVINLCSSTTPMALRIPDAPELKRFTFFVSRRREEGRERFRLHMGHFATLAEAEEWLGVVRDLYPGAWAGDAPGKKLRAAQEAAAAAATAATAPTIVAPVTAPAAPPPLPARPAAPTQRAVPPTAAGLAARAPRRASAPPARSRTAAAPDGRTPSPAASWAPAGGRAPRQGTPSARPAAPPADGIPVVQAARFAAPPANRAAVKPSAAAAPAAPAAVPLLAAGVVQSNLRRVLADLDAGDGSAPARSMSAPPRSAPTAPASAPSAEEAGLSDTQVLRMLERRRDAAATARAPSAPPAPVVGVPEEIQLLRPDDVSTMTELRRGLTANREVFFAVQLEWSVRPIELKRVPPLAIFSAYTLYTVEGNREGRKWFGLRLGFFSDSISAKQVALYVRSEFKAVAVIPVSGREKTRATQDGRLSPSALGQAQHKEKPPEEFKLIDATGERPALSVPPAVAPAPPVTPPAPAKAGGALPGVRRNGRKKSVEETLEETLEILGASQLSLDDGRKPLINDAGVRASPSTETGTGTFAKLLERLSDRLVRGR